MGSVHTPIARFKRPLILVMAGAMVLGVSGAVGAAGPETQIKACVDKSTKEVRLSIHFNSQADCRSSESWKTWAITGPQGVTGNTGASGTNGTNGSTGATGAVGQTGAGGAVGQTGAAGATGADGDDGAVGQTGAAGATGADGAAGATGADGAAAAVGNTGADGATGATGADGATGATGADGAVGETGANGSTGAEGATGPTGADGAVGATTIEQSDLSTNASAVKTDTLTVTCPVGTTMLSGGGNTATTDSAEKAQLAASYPSGTNEWTVTATAKVGAGKVWTLRAFALCAANPD